MKPKVTLLAHTTNPISTIARVWEASKTNNPVPEVYDESDSKVLEIFQKVIDSKIPVAENIDFVFLLENVSISFREQMVRHRIGVKVGERVGIDMVPDLADSSWWSQSMRILDMSKFYDNQEFRVPDFKTDEQRDIYYGAMKRAQQNYKDLLAAGLGMEDAREVIPLGATHRITWKLNLAALQHIIGKRGCWILQGDLWEPIIRGMVEELATKVDPYFRRLIAPPCVKGDKFTGCHFKLDNERRLDKQDNLPPCSLWLNEEAGKGILPCDNEGHIDRVKEIEVDPIYQKMRKQYGDLWNRHPDTYAKL